MTPPESASGGPDLAQVIGHFEELADLPPVERERGLAALRALDADLAERVAALLRADARPGGLLDTGLAAVAPMALAQAAVDGPAEHGHAAGETIGPWSLVEPLGSGGMGEVWLATRSDGAFAQEVAIKLLKRGMDSVGVLQRFRRERQILARLEHPGIARLIDGGMTPAGLPYFAMERIRGRPISAFAEASRLDVRARVRLAIALCEAVDFAHRQLVIHRDLKPANVLVTDDGSLKVLDFGIAKVLDESDGGAETQTEARVMSPAWASPEQLAGEPVAIATDVYAIGLILYELLSGRLPHGRTDSASAKVSAELTRDATQPPSEALARATDGTVRARPGIDHELDLIVLQSLRRDPGRRYPGAAALADDLQRWLERLPVRARPSSRAYRAGKFVSRHRYAVAAVACAVLSMLAATLIAIDQRRIALAQRQVALDSEAQARAAARRAELSKNFLTSMIDRADAFSSDHRGETTVVQLLESAPQWAHEGLATEPEVLGELLLEIGSGLGRAGRRDSADAVMRQALAAIERAPSADPALRAKAHNYVGFSDNDHGRLDEARMHLHEAITYYASDPTRWRRELIASRTGLARNASLRGRYAESLELREAILRDRIALQGERDPDFAMDLMNLSTSLSNLGRHAESEAALARSLALLTELLGPGHLRTLVVQRAHAHVLLDLGRIDEARRTADAVLERSAPNQAAAGTLQPLAYGVLARAALLEHRLEDSERFARSALAGDLPSAQRAGVLRLAGLAALARGRLPAAAASFRQGIDALGAGIGDSPQRLNLAFLLAVALHRDDAVLHPVESVRSAYEALHAAEGAGSTAWFDATLLIGRLERERMNVDGALTRHREALAMADTYGVLGALGGALARAELALDLAARGGSGDAQAARDAALAARSVLGAAVPRDPRIVALDRVIASGPTPAPAAEARPAG